MYVYMQYLYMWYVKPKTTKFHVHCSESNLDVKYIQTIFTTKW